MRHEILIRADGESSASLRNLIKNELPDGFRVQDLRPQRGGFGAADPQTLALVVPAAVTVLTALISAVATVWAARVAARASSAKASAAPARVPVVVISTQTADIRIALQPDMASALTSARVPNDLQQIVEIRLEAPLAPVP